MQAVSSVSDMSEIAARPPSPVAAQPPVLPSPPSCPPPGSSLPVHSMPPLCANLYYAFQGTVVLYYKIKTIFFIFCVCLLCFICVKSIVNILQCSTI